MVSLMPLPDYKVGGPIDMSPINNALDTNARMAQQNYQFEKQNKLAENYLGLAQKRDTREQQQSDQTMRMQKFKGLVGLAQLAANEKDPTRRQQYLDRALAMHPDGANIDKIYRDPINGPKLILAEASQMGPQEWANMGLVEANTAAAWAQARAAGQKTQFDAVMARLLGGALSDQGEGGPPPPAPPSGGMPSDGGGAPRLQPQSYVPGGPQQPQMTPTQYGGAGPMSPMSPQMGAPRLVLQNTGTEGTLNPMPTAPPRNALAPNALAAVGQPPARGQNMLMPPQSRDPNFILAQAGGSSAPATPPPPPVAAPETYQTGLGPMTRERAERLGMGLALAGKGDAGKMLTDSIQRGAIDKEGRNKLDKDLIDTSQRYHRLQAIASSFKPQYLEIPFRAKMWGNALKAKFGSLPQNEQGELYKYATFRRDAAQELNELVRERSGGAVTPQEFQRQGVEVPNAGNGIFDGDDPVTFQAKFDRAYEVVALGMARNAYLRKADARNAGATTAELARMMPVERFRAQVNQRAKQLEGQVRQQNPGLPKQIVDQEVDRLVKQEFGI
jgi:hypothetical protein